MKTLRNKILGAAVVGSLLVLAGCVVTAVHPYYTKQDLVSDPALPGRWAQAAVNPETEHWQFTAADGGGYKLSVQDGDERTEYAAHLFQLKGRRFLDAVPTRDGGDFIPPHYLAHVTKLSAAELELSLMNYEWLKTLVKEQPKAIRHLWTAGSDGQPRLVLTAATAELQAFVLKHVADTNAFKPAISLRRR